MLRFLESTSLVNWLFDGKKNKKNQTSVLAYMDMNT